MKQNLVGYLFKRVWLYLDPKWLFPTNFRSICHKVCLDKQLPNASLENGLCDNLIYPIEHGDVLHLFWVIRGQHANIWLYGLYSSLFAAFFQKLFDCLCSFQSIQVWHVQIHDDQLVWSLLIGELLLDHFQGLLAVASYFRSDWVLF